MDTNRIDTGNLRVPSGFEVESASLHMPSAPAIPVSDVPSDLSTPTWKEKLSSVPALVKSRVASVKPVMTSKLDTVRSTMQRSSVQLSDSLRSKTAMWAGIATASGVGLGLLGRLALHHAHKKNRMPAVVIIEASC